MYINMSRVGVPQHSQTLSNWPQEVTSLGRVVLVDIPSPELFILAEILGFPRQSLSTDVYSLSRLVQVQ